MKSLTKPSLLTAVCFAAGVICICTQQWLFSAVDEKGLLPAGHPGGIVTQLMLVICAALLLVNLPHKGEYRFDNTGLSAVGALISAVGCLAGAWVLFREPLQVLNLIGGAVGVVSALCAVAIALDRRKNRQSKTLLYCPIAFFTIFYAVSRYQQWSGESEILRMLFPLLGALGLMLSTYYRAAYQESGKGGKTYLLLSRATMFCCLAAVPQHDFGLMYGAMALYILLDGIAAQPREA